MTDDVAIKDIESLNNTISKQLYVFMHAYNSVQNFKNTTAAGTKKNCYPIMES